MNKKPLNITHFSLKLVFVYNISFMDLLTRRVLKGSPSSTINALLITESFVTELPTIFILSIKNF